MILPISVEVREGAGYVRYLVSSSLADLIEVSATNGADHFPGERHDDTDDRRRPSHDKCDEDYFIYSDYNVAHFYCRSPDVVFVAFLFKPPKMVNPR